MRPTSLILDRDGTILDGIEYKTEIAHLQLIPGVVEALRRIHQSGIRLFMATNQSVVARGRLTIDEAHALNVATVAMLAREGVPMEGWAMCPHHPEGTIRHLAVVCCCRKPAPGMLLRLADKYSFSLSHTVMVGDNLSDIEAGDRAGCLDSWLVCTGHGLRFRPQVRVDRVVPSLAQVAERLLRVPPKG